MQDTRTLDAASVAYALKTGATGRSRKEFADAIWIGFKLGALIFFLLMVVDMLRD
jgi:hypothetical protein